MLIDDFKNYLKRIGVGVHIGESRVVTGLPLFTEAANDWFDAEIGGCSVVLAVAKRNGLAPQDVVAQWKSIQRITGLACVMVLQPENESYCAVLNAAKVDYVMPNSRLHVCGKMMLVTRPASRGGYVPKSRMTIAAQRIVLHYLLNGRNGRSSFAELLASLDMGKVQISFAARELERLNLCSIDRSWRAHAFVWTGDKRSLWARAQPKMSSPVQRRIRVRKPPKGLPIAGIEALSSLSLLASDDMPTYAISRKDERVGALIDAGYEGPFVEVWKYDPTELSAEGNCVDPLSLYLSLREDPDPRVQGELKTLLEKREW